MQCREAISSLHVRCVGQATKELFTGLDCVRIHFCIITAAIGLVVWLLHTMKCIVISLVALRLVSLLSVSVRYFTTCANIIIIILYAIQCNVMPIRIIR